MNTLSQDLKVLNHIQTKGSITSWEAIKRYRITRLSAMIYNLKKMGYAVKCQWENRNGKHYKRYYL